MEKLLAEAANSTVRGVEIRKTIAHRNCQTILKANIWIAEDVEKFLGDNGLKVDKDGNCASVGTTVPNSKQKAAQLQRDVDIKNDAASRSQLEIQTLNVSCASDLVRLSDNFINDLNFTQLSTKLMCFIEEDAWSAQNLRKQCIGMKDLKKKELGLRNLEYDTGVGRQFHLIGETSRLGESTCVLEDAFHCPRPPRSRSQVVGEMAWRGLLRLDCNRRGGRCTSFNQVHAHWNNQGCGQEKCAALQFCG